MIALQPVEIALDDDVSIFGELATPPDPKGTVLVVHAAQADLDSVRAFAQPLHVLQLSTLLLDLPGHGLSGGSWEADGRRGMAAALAVSQGYGTTAVLAVGDACGALFSVDPGDVCAVALVAPRIPQQLLAEDNAWRWVPQIAMGDSADPEMDQTLGSLGQWVRAWAMRLHVHTGPWSAGRPEAWPPQMVHSAAAFIAEQMAYRMAPRPADRPLAAEGETARRDGTHG
jgi:hypothetical protein